MRYSSIGSHRISRLTLGTVHLGTVYGVSNSYGKPTEKVAFEILKTALSCGVNTIDTSPSYGNAEELLGRFLLNEQQGAQPVLVTKCKLKTNSTYDLDSIRKEIYESVKGSLSKLKISRIPVLLFHTDQEQRLEKLIQYLSIVFNQLKEDGLVDKAGISAYAPGDIDFVLNNPTMEVVQIPLNVFDVRLIWSGRLTLLQQQQKLVFARSIFLQGLLFLAPDELPEKLESAKPFLSLLHTLARDCNLTVPELAFGFVKDLDSISSLLFGAVSPEQVKQNVAFMNMPTLPGEVSRSIVESFAEVPEMIITPGMWRL